MGVMANTDELARDLASTHPSLDEVAKVVEKRLGSSGFSIFSKVEQGQLLALLGNPRKAIQYAIGNPLLAIQMIAHVPEVALYAPSRLTVYESDQGETFVAYDRFSPRLAQYRHPEIERIARLVERTLEALKILCVVVAVLLSSTMSFAQDTPKAEVSAGYSFFYVIKGFTIVNNGGSGSLAVNLNDWLGLVGDFGVYRASSNGPDLTSETFTFGPRFSYRELPHLIPFAQALFGGYHASVNTGGIEQGTEFTFSFGGGADLPVGRSRKWALRGQAEYFGVRAFGSTTNVARISAGIVYRFHWRD